jgi:hypothetical protein
LSHIISILFKEKGEKPRNSEADLGGRKLPGRQFSPDVGSSQVEACGWHALGLKRYLNMERLKDMDKRVLARG